MELAQLDTRPILLVTTVDIGDGQAGKIEIREGDDPVDAAREFCQRYGLPDSIVGPLSLHICENIERGADEPEQAAAQGIEAADPPAAPAGSSPPEPASPTIDAYLPDDSPCASNGRAQPQYQQQLGYDQPAAYAPTAYERAAAATLYPAAPSARTHSSDVSEVLLPPQPRPASAPYAQEPAAARAAPVRRPASVNSSYSRGPTSSGGSGGSSHGRPPAHNRLYADYFSKQSRLEEERRLRDLDVQLKMQQVHVTPVSQHLAAHRNASGYKNYGERLYVEGRLDTMRKEKEVERLKQQEAEEELAECVFRPEISKLAKTLKAVDSEAAGGAAWQRLYQRSQVAAKRQERMESIRKEQQEDEVRECTFRPQINNKSLKMVAERQTILKESGIPGYEQLFNDSMRRRLKQEHLARQAPEDATFQPRINTSSVVLRRLLEKQQGEEEAGLVGGDVAARLLERGRKYQENLQHAREVLHGAMDPATGKPLYRPQTCRAPKFARNPAGQPIGEYLYNIQQEREEKMSQVLSSTKQRAEADASSTYVNKRSEKLVVKLKRERFRAIFDYLCRGEVPGEGLNLVEVVQDETFMDTIDPEVRADIEYAAKLLARYIAKRDTAELQDSADSAAQEEPLPMYGNSEKGEVTGSGFHALMEEVLQRTAGISRQYLLPMPTGRKKFEEPTFAPTIDPNSKLIAARRRPDHVPAYEVLYKTAEEVEHKREQRKKLMEAARMEECVFNPKLQAKQLAKEGRALKLAANLSMARRGQGEDDQRSMSDRTPAAAAAEQDLEHIDQIERQIQDALVRLSLNGEAMAAMAGAQAALAAASGDGKSQRGSFDASALFGTPPASSLGQYNPMEGGGCDSPHHAHPTTLEWCESGNDLVANVVDEGGELEGLDLHAIASASIDVVPGGGFVLAQRQQVAASPAESAA